MWKRKRFLFESTDLWNLSYLSGYFRVVTERIEPKKTLAKEQVTLMLDPDVLALIERRALALRERRNALIQRLLIEHLEKVGLWPPEKTKSPRG